MMLLDGRVAIVTGAGGGLGRAHALLLARHGARVVVNDLGDGAARVAEDIRAAGGEAIAVTGSVTDAKQVDAMVDAARDAFGTVHILVNNAGILRDASFAKMSVDDFRLVVEVHLMGAVLCTKAVWGLMRDQNYGRIVMTTSSSGLFGNFGQSNYGAAKMALVGLMQTLAIEGAKNNIRVNCLAPTAATAMTDSLLPPPMKALLQPEHVSPGLITLVSKDAPTRAILAGGAGHFERAYVTLTGGAYIGDGEDAAEQVVKRWDAIGDRGVETVPAAGGAQIQQELIAAAKAKNIG
ncbi:NAD(P)-dependent dehydrogenase (short-subunit alcohol dehydrogenase family) [Sphingomonas abaci]|uniref:NAD(P)-dependent dehydrogenase (Short-subunit alcohol dehydrogenase family) n=2 Tax=Sphingomonas abaci TaxID=237611 RepID=A0A7W7AFY5_9SPHN|nr:NAD(P)-dependent dehydrogenase (short-subunit alcohol dehydrogenase family) [Sphingomonas abaci]